jgi:transcriptional regulator with XRE-family HTH domain
MKKEEDFLKLVGEHIMVLRKRKGLTQKELADGIEATSVHIGRIERGESNVTILMLARIAKALNVSLSELVDIKLGK